MRTVLIGYVPVLHQGYINLFMKHSGVDFLAIFGEEIIAEFDHLVRKDIRALDSRFMRRAIFGLGIFKEVRVLDLELVAKIIRERPLIIMPDEDEGRVVAEKYFPGSPVEFESVFLRWDMSRSVKEVPVESKSVTVDEFHRRFMWEAYALAPKSSDWWRQIGSMAVRNGEILLAGFNHHMPSPITPYVLGDPRSLFKKGIAIELGTVLHGEAEIVASASRVGIPLFGADLYVTTFPCPSCAKLIARAGIANLFFKEGYAMLDGESVLKAHGIGITRVVFDSPPEQ